MILKIDSFEKLEYAIEYLDCLYHAYKATRSQSPKAKTYTTGAAAKWAGAVFRRREELYDQLSYELYMALDIKNEKT